MPNYTELIESIRVRLGDYQNQTYNENYLREIAKLALANTRLASVITSSVSLIQEIGGTYSLSRNIDQSELLLFSIAAHLQHLYSKKTSSDESSLSMSKGRLRIDNTSQSRSLSETIRLVEEEFSREIRNYINLQGVRVE